MQVQPELITTIRSLVDLEHSKAGNDLYFEISEAIALIFPRCLKEQLQQLVNGPIWDGDIISKNHRGILFEMDLVTRVCCKGEQGYTGARYIAYSVLKKIKEQQSELESILNSESDKPVRIDPDGNVHEC